MAKHWEYLTLVWTKRVEKKTKKEEVSKTSRALSEIFWGEARGSWEPREIEYWSYTETYYIRRPDELRDEERPGMSTDVEDSRSDTVGLLNELGQEGWEIIDRIVYRSAIGEALGWPKAGSPIEVSWLMKREAPEARR